MDVSRVIEAAVIVIGLYMILWGRSKDQCHSKLQNTQYDVARNSQQMAIINGDIEASKDSLNDKEENFNQKRSNVQIFFDNILKLNS